MSESHDNAENRNGNAEQGSTAIVSIQIPGIDMTEVIPSKPYMIKENSSRIETKELKLDKR
jgi:hypothetical protein